MGIALLLFWAATAKSAQVPLYVWLPDAMEGPTPVSALIHAATMVTAGVYLIARSTPADRAWRPRSRRSISAIGCLTALLSASIALTQTDLKRVLAYSTVSQLGYMFMALGSGVGDVAQLAVVAAMFHLFTHAFFKALLFLASGSVMHAMGGVIDMRRFGGLRHRLPYTCWTFAVGGLALSGIPPFAGFWSKDEILVGPEGGVARRAAEAGAGRTLAIYWVAVVTACLTAFYTGRAFFLTFFGPEKLPSPDDPEAADSELAHGSPPAAHHDPGHGHVPDEEHDASHFGHESPPVMTIPLMILAVCAVLVGPGLRPDRLVRAPPGRRPSASRASATSSTGTAPTGRRVVIGTLAGLLGLGLSYLMYFHRGPLPGRLARGSGRSTGVAATSSTSTRSTTRRSSGRCAGSRRSATSSTTTWWTAWCG